MSKNDSKCPCKDLCGSCGWSHIPYEKQLKQKLSDINGSFALKELPVECTEILPSPKQDHYRNRMDFVIDFEGRVGLRQKGKWWRVIDDHSCFIADEVIDGLFQRTREQVQSSGLSYYDRKAHTGLLRYAVIRCTSLEQSSITIVTSQTVDQDDYQKTREVLTSIGAEVEPTTLLWARHSGITDVSFGDELEVLSGPGFIEEQVHDVRFQISPQAFFQTNSYCAPLLLDTVREAAGDLQNKFLLDLYCGSGFFAVGIGGSASRVAGVEEVGEAIVDARKNAELNGVEAEFRDVRTEDTPWYEWGADVAILDPPRSGLHKKALKAVIEQGPPVVVYVACSFKNFARELVELSEVYDLASIRAIDMFPHTPHVELVSRLERKS